ncbi:lysophospholipid acyltransferase family protein [Dentiradicibacter hellwigii]|uniref:Lysophospholipid acyltransferase family protein n=1 Tax=Dentiradicibacter hellwigii TaxID=3149053 RepID=A0ABV4UC89_9RHOO
MIALFRTLIFAPLAILTTLIASVLVLLTAIFPMRVRFAIIRVWYTVVLGLCKTVLGLRYRLLGREHIPSGACVVLAKHESAWETIALQQIFPPVVFVLKKSLLNIPILGWAFIAVRMISIDRKAGRDALRQVAEQGQKRLAEGISVAIFPEGTRTLPGEIRRFKPGGAYLAVSTGAVAVPVAHNAGDFWSKRFAKRAGEIIVSVGPPIDPKGKTAEEVNRLAEAWVSEEMQRIAPYRNH